MTASDRLALLNVLGVTVRLRDDGAALELHGRAVLVAAAEPVVRKHTLELLEHLRAQPTTRQEH